MPPTPRLEIDPPESEAEGCIFERVEPSTSEILAPVKMKIGLGNETANNTSASPLVNLALGRFSSRSSIELSSLTRRENRNASGREEARKEGRRGNVA